MESKIKELLLMQMVAAGGSGITPSGTKQITENGTHDVTQYASAAVAVPNEFLPEDASTRKQCVYDESHENFWEANIGGNFYVPVGEGYADFEIGDHVLVTGDMLNDNTGEPEAYYAIWGTVYDMISANTMAAIEIEGMSSRVYTDEVHKLEWAGEHRVFGWAVVDVDIPAPTGAITVTQNGNYDVSQYGTAVVAVPPSSGVSEKWAQLFTINNGAYAGSISISDADVPSGWSLYVGDYEFAGRSLLKSISSNSVRTIGTMAFSDATYLQSVYFPKLVSVSTNAFANAGRDTTWNGDFNESLKNVTTLSSGAFSNAYISGDLVFPSLVSMSNGDVFSNAKKITGLKFPALTSGIPYRTALGCIALKHFEAPLSSGTVGWNAFESCRALEYAVFGAITNVQYLAFKSCTSLKHIVIGGTSVCTLEQTSAFNGCTALESIYVPDALVDAYKTATNWATMADKIKPVSERPTP